MKILNFGSLNIDYVYQVEHFVKKGETLSSHSMNTYAGGKGLNQSIALAKTGVPVYHAGKIGHEGKFLKEELEAAGVHTDYISECEVATGHAIIQIDAQGDNCILLFPGANKSITPDEIEQVIDKFETGDILLLQNEVNGIDIMIKKAKKKGMVVVMNPAPFDDGIKELPLDLIDLLILNEVEGQGLSSQVKTKDIVGSLNDTYKDMAIILTIGSEGLIYSKGDTNYRLKPSHHIDPVDTTAAGDTFIGYYLAEMMKGREILTSLTTARNASECCIMKSGASISVPFYEEVEAYSNLVKS